MSPFFIFQWFFSTVSAVKGVCYPLLIRFGVLWGIGPGACDKGTFGRTWGLHSTKVMHNLHDKLVEKLDSDDPFAPFDALCFLIGHKNATAFCKGPLGFPLRPPSERTSLPRTSHSLIVDIDMDL